MKNRAMQEIKANLRYTPDPSKPPPPGAPLGTGAWENGRPDSEALRQGEFTSPWTGQVYDRWAPLGSGLKGTDRQGGLGRARAFETPMQRRIREAMGFEPDTTPEHEKYYPGTAPIDKQPSFEETEKPPLERYAGLAGGFRDVFCQIVVQTVIDLRKAKSEDPLWYVEAMAGEGEYHSSRLTKPGDDLPEEVLEPTVETVYECFKRKGDTYLVPEIEGFLDAVDMLNEKSEDFEVKGPEADADPEEDGIQWLPSTALVALRALREQDKVSLFEMKKPAFAALYNFVRNWSHKWKPRIELKNREGTKILRKSLLEHKGPYVSEAFGHREKERGIILLDPKPWESTAKTPAEYIRMWMNEIWTHWRSATTIVIYDLKPLLEDEFQRIIRDLQDENPGMDLLVAEMFVDTPGWQEGDPLEDKWSGVACLMSLPPFTTENRLQSALTSLCEEVSSMPGASEMRVSVNAIGTQSSAREDFIPGVGNRRGKASKMDAPVFDKLVKHRAAQMSAMG